VTDNSRPTLLLVNARLVLPEQVAADSTLLFENGRIASISANDSLAVDRAEIDLRGLTVFPGFIDVHIHGAVGVDTMEASTADLDVVSRFLATRGVTGWLPTLVPAPARDYARAVEAIKEAQPSKSGARVLGVHYEGPFVNSSQCGALRAEFFRSFSKLSDLDDLPRIDNPVARHMITVAPEVEGGIELVRELTRRGWIVSVGHTRASFDLLDQALAVGARHMTHFMNAMAPLHHRSPGPVGWGLSHDQVTCDIIADGIHLDPHMLQVLVKLKGPGRLTLISDAIAAAGRGDGDYEIWDQTIRVKDGRTSNARGDIAGSVISLLDAVRLMRSNGVSETDVAKMAATNPARLLGVDDSCGSIEAGKRADLVALDARGEVALTIIGGEIVFKSGER
jgi:N-acetylglucosamine-6-phosphate deacetylase